MTYEIGPLRGRTAIVTHAATPVGRSICIALSNASCAVIGFGDDLVGLDELEQDLGLATRFVALSDVDQVRADIDTLPPIDLVVMVMPEDADLLGGPTEDEERGRRVLSDMIVPSMVERGSGLVIELVGRGASWIGELGVGVLQHVVPLDVDEARGDVARRVLALATAE